MVWAEIDSVMTAQAIDAGSTSYSTVIGQLNQSGFAAVQLTSTATGTFTITQQASIDGANFYNPIDQNGVGIGSVLSSASALVVLTSYIQFSPVLAPYVRLSVVPTQANTVTLKYITQGDKL